MNIAVSTEFTPVTRSMRLLYSDQLPYATSQAINDVAQQFQIVEQAHISRAFRQRRVSFTGRAVKIKPFANKRLLMAEVKIEPPGGAARADVLSKFEEGGIKRPLSGSHLVIPTQNTKIGTKASYDRNKPSAFNFKLRGSGPKAMVFAGDRGTFMIEGHDGKSGGIFQRYGRKGRQVRMLYSFARQVPIDHRLEFESNAVATVRSAWPGAFVKAFDSAVAGAKNTLHPAGLP